MSKKINVQILEKQDSIDGFASNFLRFKLSGSDINYVIANTLVRIGLSLVGSYAFNHEFITIERDTSIFNADQMRLRIGNIPIINSDYKKPIVGLSEIDMTNKCIEMETEANASIFNMKKDNLLELELIEEKRKELLNNLHMHVDARNRTNEIMNVTSNDKFTSFFLNDKKIPDIYPREVLIVKLKPGEDFICTAIADFNIPMKNNIFSSVSIFAYEEINENEFDMILESQRQISEENIVKQCCFIAIRKLQNIQKIITEKLENLQSDDVEYDAEIYIENENHTLGNLLTRALQDHPNISYCGYKIDHPDVNELSIKYKTEGKQFSKILKDVVALQTKVFEAIASKI